MELILISRSKCQDCGGTQQIVQSRQGGLVSQGCTQCERPKSRYIRLYELPALIHKGCNVELRVGQDRNYYYVCPKCGERWLVADLVPHWSECFDYDGLAAHGEI